MKSSSIGLEPMAPAWTPPELVRHVCHEGPVHLVVMARLGRIRDGRALLAPRDTLQTKRFHEPRDRATGDVLSFAAQLMPDLAGSVTPAAGIKNAFDLSNVPRIPFRTVRRQIRVVGFLSVMRLSF